MSRAAPHTPEIIQSKAVIPLGNVSDVEGFRTTWSIIIAVMALLIAVGTLIAAISFDKAELVTWSTGLISAIAGSAISYGFTGKHRS
jgi:hypothetical protein